MSPERYLSRIYDVKLCKISCIIMYFPTISSFQIPHGKCNNYSKRMTIVIYKTWSQGGTKIPSNSTARIRIWTVGKLWYKRPLDETKCRIDVKDSISILHARMNLVWPTLYTLSNVVNLLLRFMEKIKW